MQCPFTVLIIGSSPAALALALALTQQKTAFTLLTRASSLIPAEQPPITLHPHAVAILDQLDVWRKIKDDAVEISNPLWARLGYPLVILQERRLREALCGGIPLSGIHTKKKVVDTRADERGVTVITGDMEVFSADIIVDFDSIWEEFSQGEFASYWGIAQTTGRSFITEKGITCLTAAGCWWAVLKIPPPVTASNARALEILEKFRQGEEEPEMVLEGVARKWSEERILLMGDGAWQVGPPS
ncbi:Similar to putative FAD-dependent monooxygenase; acc. no. CBF87267 [Pyronema omphalodes CBS 100304]|uniref:Similar to putative FAD-dependent monooxygenase acc. no. CBF87267 n=1 Tax=Pyronema omphalodes (strain CBS 100304) TaxID=1076935 RepID=U4LF72_PYROM|nr:Similar to putative FAD-dependent monooxygenase; acc. no. CBF87267 [Pyronema omphalodes CBS 100304]